MPVHISARPEDLPSLVNGLLEFNTRSAEGLDPVAAAAALAFALVYIHPFVDGNGRIHRYLVHHVLAERGFTPSGVVFPVSAVILRRMAGYRDVLQQHSQKLLPLIDWEATADGNVRVRGETADLYRYFDATPHAEYLFGCVQATLEHDLPREAALLQAHDRFATRVQELVDLPARTLDLLFRFLRQNQGRLSQRARTRELKALTAEEVATIEAIYHDEFEPGS